MNLKETAAHIRKRLKHEGIKAKVRVAPGGGCVQVNAPAYGVEFSEEEQRKIRFIATCLNLTGVRGTKIVIERMTNPYDFHFYIDIFK